MSKIVFTLEFAGTNSNELANEYLQKGWILLSVGPKCVGTLNNTDDQADYETAYVVGATQQQYEEYKAELADGKKQWDEFL
ncbi:hypothetical protein [Lactobacillus sp. LL6]|uniref:hypothetical protein n=1 Tax=Lactobacillus sp. LL6 TaxID=2596827 RepID=UPI0011855755|nr:hypothetical protein [Lactobacillus sp. LL6]TSO25320.1 hypothetical protein FOD82_08770 [Lactobacillus sp. LL6]